MTSELFWLTLTALLAASLWIPYIIGVSTSGEDVMNDNRNRDFSRPSQPVRAVFAICSRRNGGPSRGHQHNRNCLGLHRLLLAACYSCRVDDRRFSSRPGPPSHVYGRLGVHFSNCRSGSHSPMKKVRCMAHRRSSRNVGPTGRAIKLLLIVKSAKKVVDPLHRRINSLRLRARTQRIISLINQFAAQRLLAAPQSVLDEFHIFYGEFKRCVVSWHGLLPVSLGVVLFPIVECRNR